MEENTGKKKWLIGIAVYTVLLFAILLISKIGPLTAWFGAFFSLVRPIVIGLVIAYLANPFFRLFERKLFFRVRPKYFRRVLSLICTYLVFLLILALLVILIFPQLSSSIRDFLAHFEERVDDYLPSINRLIDRINEFLPRQTDGAPAVTPLTHDAVMNGMGKLGTSLSGMVTERIGFTNVSRIWQFLSETAVILKNLLVGIFLSLYFLASKEKRYAQVMKARRALFSDRVNRHITHICAVADRSFGGFLRGKIIDSLIVGVLVYLACLIFRIPYPLLVAAIVGITDIVPVIGPFIGVIPTAIIILLTDPIKVIFFLLSILVIQQIDGNIIAPKILGDHTGVSSLCVMISIILMGSLFGLVGMLIGVPLFATVLELLGVFLDKRLQARGSSPDAERFYSGEIYLPDLPDSTPKEEPQKESFDEKYSRLSREAGSGDLSFMERIQLRTFRLVRKHHLYSDFSEETLTRFAEEENAVFFETATPTEPKEPEQSDKPNSEEGGTAS